MVNEADLKRPLVPLKVAKASLELHLGIIPGRVGSCRVGSNSDYKSISDQLPAETELGNIGRGAKGDYQKYHITLADARVNSQKASNPRIS